MTTATIPQSILNRLQTEAAEQQAAARSAAVAELATVTEQLEREIPPLDAKVAAAREAFLKVKQETDAALKAAADKLQEAQQTRGAADYQLCHRRDTLQAQLSTTLAHPSVLAALAEVESIFDSARHYNDPDQSVHAGAVIAWCQTARAQLTELQFSDSDDIDLSVQAIMSTRP